MSRIIYCPLCRGVFEIEDDYPMQSLLICPTCGELWSPPGYEPITAEFYEIEGDEEE